MNLSDYICEDCKKITEFDKVYGNNNFPEKIKCEHCGSTNTRRIWNNHISIPQSFKAV
jgi:DNA-directed RNA polymerase subunit RPC12/RpoP